MSKVHIEITLTKGGSLEADVDTTTARGLMDELQWTKVLIRKDVSNGNGEARVLRANRKIASKLSEEERERRLKHATTRGHGSKRRGLVLATLRHMKENGPMTTEEITEFSRKWGARNPGSAASQLAKVGYIALNGEDAYQLTRKGVRRSEDDRLIVTPSRKRGRK